MDISAAIQKQENINKKLPVFPIDSLFIDFVIRQISTNIKVNANSSFMTNLGILSKQ